MVYYFSGVFMAVIVLYCIGEYVDSVTHVAGRVADGNSFVVFLLIWLINRIVGEERRREVLGAIKLCRLFVSGCDSGIVSII